MNEVMRLHFAEAMQRKTTSILTSNAGKRMLGVSFFQVICDIGWVIYKLLMWCAAASLNWYSSDKKHACRGQIEFGVDIIWFLGQLERLNSIQIYLRGFPGSVFLIF